MGDQAVKLTNYEKRRLEWGIAITTTGFGLWLLAPMASMDSAAYLQLRAWLSEPAWGLFFLDTGGLHAIALQINGRRWWTPFARAGMLILNAFAYLFFAAGFYTVDPASTAVYIYGPLMTFLLMSALHTAAQDCYRAWMLYRRA